MRDGPRALLGFYHWIKLVNAGFAHGFAGGYRLLPGNLYLTAHGVHDLALLAKLHTIR